MSTQNQDWPQRTWALGIAGAVIGFLIYLISEASNANWRSVGYGLSAFLAVTGVAAAFVVERGRLGLSAAFAVIAGMIVGFAAYWNGGPEGAIDWETWRILAAALTVAIAAPLFQAWGDAGMPRPPRLAHINYPTVHDRAWTNVVLWFACWAFTGVIWLLLSLIAQLFDLIGIKILSDLLTETWFGYTLTGAAFGAVAGLMRDRERILVTLQTVVRKVLSVLAPVLGTGLILFLVATLFTGLAPLWEATKATTPILIAAVAVAIILANAAIGDSREDEAKLSVVRWGTAALSAAILPLAVIAAVSTGSRIAQYGLTPDRLWAGVFVIIASSYSGAYLFNLVRNRNGWMAGIRRTNVILAIALCGLAFLLSTPLINFGAWSTASQVARLESGKVAPAKFDWAALRFDFGTSGEAAVKRLAKAGKTPEIRLAAATAEEQTDRWAGEELNEERAAVDNLDARLRVLPARASLSPQLRRRLVEWDACGRDDQQCAVLMAPDAKSAIIVRQRCAECDIEAIKFERDGETWKSENERGNEQPNAGAKQRPADLKSGRIEIRNVTRRQVFVDGQPSRTVFE